jgi:hypothetical protein
MMNAERNENFDPRDPTTLFWRILQVAALMGVLAFAITHGSLMDRIGNAYPTLASLAVWVAGMLSYHQDAKRRDPWWAILSQTLAVVCVIAIMVFGFSRGLWVNFLIAPLLAGLQIQFTKRWWANPGAWW